MPDDDATQDMPADEAWGKFEWDEGKREANIEKHGIDFFRARHVFRDPEAITIEGLSKSNEKRHIIVGRLDEVLIAVVYTVRNEHIRIISARRARRSERKRYGQ